MGKFKVSEFNANEVAYNLRDAADIMQRGWMDTDSYNIILAAAKEVGRRAGMVEPPNEGTNVS